MTILVVEDNKQISGLIKKGLEMNDFRVETAYDGSEAFDLARKNVYQAIIMDVMLPKMSGFEVTRKLRQEKIYTPIIMVSGRDSVEERQEGSDAGANDYLIKPFVFSELINRINFHSAKKPAPKFR